MGANRLPLYYASSTGLSGDFMDSREPIEETIKDVEAILTGAGMANDTLAATTSIFHLVRDGAAILDGFRDDAEETGGKEKRAQEKAAKERRQAQKQGAQSD